MTRATDGFDLVHCERDGELLLVRLADPERSNPLTPQMVGQLRSALELTSGASTMVLAAEGRNFCGGGDHDQLATLGRDEFRTYVNDVRSLFAEVAGSPVPVVAGIQGAVVGGGLELALRCDLLVAADDARFRLPQVEQGGRISRESYAVLFARIGLGFARRMTMLGESMTAPAALAAGLVDYVVRRADLENAATSLGRELAAQPADSVARTRRATTEWLMSALQDSRTGSAPVQPNAASATES